MMESPSLKESAFVNGDTKKKRDALETPSPEVMLRPDSKNSGRPPVSPLQKRSGFIDRNGSSTSLRRVKNSPKTPNRSMFSTPTQTTFSIPGRKNGNRTPKGDRSKTERLLANLVTEKSRLVEQFYSAFNDGNYTSKDELYGSGVNSPSKEMTEGTFVDNEEDVEYSENTFLQLINQGGLKYIPLDQHITHDENITNSLLNIDHLVNEQEEILDDDKHLRVLAEMFDSIESQLKEEQQVRLKNNEYATSLDQITKLGRYLTSIQSSMSSVYDELHSNREPIKEKYHSRIKENLDKLGELSKTLEGLEERLSKSKESITDKKSIMSQELLEKFEVLDYIEKKFDEHTKLQRNRRFKQFNVVLVVVLVLVSIYIGFVKSRPPKPKTILEKLTS